MPASFDLNVWKGNTFDLKFSVKTRVNKVLVPVDLTGSTLVFRAAWESGSIRKVSGDADFSITNAVDGQVSLTLSHTETRQLPKDQTVRYEIERRIDGAQKTVLFGIVKVSEWVNDDG